MAINKVWENCYEWLSVIDQYRRISISKLTKKKDKPVDSDVSKDETISDDSLNLQFLPLKKSK